MRAHKTGLQISGKEKENNCMVCGCILSCSCVVRFVEKFIMRLEEEKYDQRLIEDEGLFYVESDSR